MLAGQWFVDSSTPRSACEFSFSGSKSLIAGEARWQTGQVTISRALCMSITFELL